MSNKGLPESIKIAKLQVSASATHKGHTFPINMGQDEVMVLLALWTWWYGYPAAGGNLITIGLWNKSDEANDPATIVGEAEHSSMIWCIRDGFQYVTESTKKSNAHYLVFPSPLILIRAPRLITRRTTMTECDVHMSLYYQLRDVSDVDLAKLMVKDHA